MTSPTCTLEEVASNDTLGRRASGLLAPVQSQGWCGSCWAFAATHTFTDTCSIQAGSRTPLLSSQYTTSCLALQARNAVENGIGCCGGSVRNGLQYFGTRGALTDTCAPYHPFLRSYIYDKEKGVLNPSIDHTCPATCADGTEFNPGSICLAGIRNLPPEAAVIQALASGPGVVGTSVSFNYKYMYRCGIFCYEAGDHLLGRLHAVEIVDYGTENGVDFWVIKNSWGTEWGMEGYIMMSRNRNNNCGIATQASYPKV